MKFCTKCGRELVDDAIICTNCGRMVENIPSTTQSAYAPPPQKSLEATPGKAPSVLLSVFNFLFSLLASFSVFNILLSVGCGQVSSYISSYGRDVYSTLYPHEGFVILGLIFSALALIFSFVCFILTLVEKQKGERLFSGILKLILGFLLVIAPYCLLMA